MENMINSDPARDVIRALEILNGTNGIRFVDKLASAGRVAQWSPEFYLLCKLLQENVLQVQSCLMLDEDNDDEDASHIDSNIARILSGFEGKSIIGDYRELCNSDGPFGSNTNTFLKSSSRAIRRHISYEHIGKSEVDLINSAISNIRADMDGLHLERADFAREALLRGCSEVAFIINRVDMLGFARAREPTMELGAFLFAIVQELKETSDEKRVSKSLQSLKHVYDRIYEMYKGASMVKMAYDGLQWLISGPS